jgi:hypothetical protein
MHVARCASAQQLALASQRLLVVWLDLQQRDLARFEQRDLELARWSPWAMVLADHSKQVFRLTKPHSAGWWN